MDDIWRPDGHMKFRNLGSGMKYYRAVVVMHKQRRLLMIRHKTAAAADDYGRLVINRYERLLAARSVGETEAVL